MAYLEEHYLELNTLMKTTGRVTVQLKKIHLLELRFNAMALHYGEKIDLKSEGVVT